VPNLIRGFSRRQAKNEKDAERWHGARSAAEGLGLRYEGTVSRQSRADEPQLFETETTRLDVTRKDPPPFAAFELLREVNRARPFRGVLRGSWKGEELCIFEYTHGDDEHPTSETAVCFLGDAPRLPPFVVGPRVEGLFEWLVGRKDLVFDHPRFSGEYEVGKHPAHEAADQELLRLFTPEVMDYLVAHAGLRVESLGRQLLVYRAGRVVPADEIEPFVVEAYGLLAALLRAARPVSPELLAPPG
jgi:hypothetical protein